MKSPAPDRFWRAASESWQWVLLLGLGASLITVFLPPSQALLIGVPLLAAVGFALFYVAPPWGLIVLLVSFYNPAISFLRLNLEVWSYALTLGIFGVTAVALLLRQRYELPPSWGWAKGMTWGLGIVFLVAGLHGLWRGNDVRYVVSDLIQGLELIGFFWLTAAVLWHYGRLRFILATISVVVLVTLIWEQILYFNEGSAFFSLLPQSRALYPAVLGGSYVLAGSSRLPATFLPLFAAVLLLAWRALPGWSRGCLLGALGLSAFSVVLSFKRSIWAAEVVAVLVIFLLSFRVLPWARIARLAALLAVACSLFVAVLAFTSWNGRSLLSLVGARAAYTVTQFRDRSNPGMESRRSEYGVVLRELERSPLLGAGLGAEYTGHTIAQGLTEKHFMHNTFLAAAFRMGTVGLVAFVGALAYLLLVPVWRLGRSMETLDQALVIGAVASICMSSFQALTMGTLLTHPIPAYAGSCLGMAHYLVRRKSVTPATGHRRPPQLPVVSTVLAEHPPEDLA